MRANRLLITLIFLWILCPYVSSQEVQKKIIRYYEYKTDAKPYFRNTEIPNKEQRVSNNEGRIILFNECEQPDSITRAIEAAVKLWSSKIPTKQPIYIKYSFEPLDDNITMIADVIHFSEGNLSGCPNALASQLIDRTSSDKGSPDGYIYFNSETEWNCFFNDSVSASEYNLTTMALRGIARCLGFGSSIVEVEKDSFLFGFIAPTYFDRLLSSGNRKLSELEEESAELAEFVTSDKVYAYTKEHTYKMYAPKQFDSGRSLCYVEDDNSLMSNDLGEGSITLDIDDITVDILRTIGWDIQDSRLKIECEDISDNGLGSSYSSHTFSLLKDGVNVTGYNWRFLLKNKQGDFVQISKSNSEKFTIEKIATPDDYHLNVNGDLEGRIECSYIVNGKNYDARPFTLSLELKPQILSIHDIEIVNHGQFAFSLQFKVSYTGADMLYVELEEEYDGVIRNYQYVEPYIAHIETGKMSNLYYSWVTIKVNNKFGSTSETIEFAPAYKTIPKYGISSLTSSDILRNSYNVERIRIYNIDSKNLFDGTPSEFSRLQLKQGIYIKNEIYENGESKTSKIYIN